MSELFYSPEYHMAVRKLEGISRQRQPLPTLTADEALSVLDCLAGYDDLLPTASLDRVILDAVANEMNTDQWDAATIATLAALVHITGREVRD